MSKKTFAVGALAFTGLIVSSVAGAVAVLCKDPTVNHMSVDSAYVLACLDSGSGDFTGNPANDPFLNGVGSGYAFAGRSNESNNPFHLSFTQQNSGTFSIDPSFWTAYDIGAIGFKFATGGRPDQWFVFQLAGGFTLGTWDFINVFGQGGRLSHVNLYSSSPRQRLPEPSSILLIAVGMLALAAVLSAKDEAN